MSRFSDNFWSYDYSTGFNVLFDKLHEGCQENQDYINLFVARQQSELIFGNSLLVMSEKFTSTGQSSPGMNSTIKQSFIGFNQQFGKEGGYHLEISRNIEERVVKPFSAWAEKHRDRVAFSENDLREKAKNFDKLGANVEKLKMKYFNKVRSAEEFKEKLEVKITETMQRASSLPPSESQDATIDANTASTLKRSNTTIVDDMKNLTLENESITSDATAATAKAGSDKEATEEAVYVLAGDEYSKQQLTDILFLLLNKVPMTKHKVPIFGTYERVSTGASIVSAIQENLGISKLEKIESFGQDLISNGFLRLVGSIGNQFANSSKLYYQWKNEAFHMAGIDVEDDSSLTFYNPVNELSQAVKLSDVLEDVRGMITTLEPNEENYRKILKDVKKAEQEYYESTKLFDAVRLEFEEAIELNLNFMQQSELDRLKALKKVSLDFLSILSNKFNSLKSVLEKNMVYQDIMNPKEDLIKMIQTFKTGPFVPRLKIFEDYFDSQDTQVFGVRLQSRCRFDHKSVPLIVSSIIMHLDEKYPTMKDDTERMGVWLSRPSLGEIHQVRNVLNDPKLMITSELLNRYPLELLTNVLKLYLLELPDSLIPSEKFDLLKSLYDQYGDPKLAKERLVGLESLLADLPRPNIATLNCLCTHLGSFIDTIAMGDSKETKTDGEKPEESTAAEVKLDSETFKKSICSKFGIAVLRPQVHYSVIPPDQISFKIFYDLLSNKNEIFKELKKRNASKKSSVSRNSSKKTSISRNTSRNASRNVSRAVDSDTLVLTVDEQEEGQNLSRKNSHDEEPDTVIKF